MRLRATLMPPSEPALPGDYDFGRQAWFARHRRRRLCVVAAEHRRRGRAKPPADLALWAGVQRLRQAIGGASTAALPGETGAIANALITGERGGISEATNDAFRDSGIVHILSISGLHMAIMAGSVFFARAHWCLRAVPVDRAALPDQEVGGRRRHARRRSPICMISGAAFATVRSAIMISIMFFAVLLDRPALALRNVVLAATLILVLFPESLFDAGFQMSFAAVSGARLRLRDAPSRRAAAAAVPRRSAARVVFSSSSASCCRR